MIDWKDCIVPAGREYKRLDLYVWVAYDRNPPYLPIAIARTADELSRTLGVSRNTIESLWSKYNKGILKRSRFHRVKVGLDPL